MDNTILIHDYFSSLPELEDPNTIESRCMLFIGQIGDTDFVEEVLTAIMNQSITFTEIAALPSITIFTLTKLLESKDSVFNLMSSISSFVGQKNILSLLINFKYIEINYNYVTYLKFYMRTISDCLPNYSNKIKLDSDVSMTIYKQRINEFISLLKNQEILNKYRNYFDPATKMNEFINALPVYTSNQLFSSSPVNITFTNSTPYSVLQLALFSTHSKKICEPNAHSTIVKKIKAEMFQQLSSPEEREKLKSGTITLQQVYIESIKSLWNKLSRLVMTGNNISFTSQLVYILSVIHDTENVQYINNQDAVKYTEFMVDYANILHALDEEVFNV